MTIESACDELVRELKSLYKDWDGSRQFIGTEHRLARLYDELCWSPRKISYELEKQVRIFDHNYKEVLICKGMDVWVLCPHHLLPCHFKVTIGYAPIEGKVLGLSKFARIAKVMGKRPIMQEAYTQELATFLLKNLEPKGIAVYVEGSHDCMIARGVEQNSSVITKVMEGKYFNDRDNKAEFLATAKG